MSLSSLQLDAFLQVARSGGFSRAAKLLHLTQSALSQRILNLEEELGAALFVREPAGVRLTDTGEELLRYCQRKQGLEEEFLGRLGGGGKGELAGVVRIAGYSTVMRSAVLPALTELVVGSAKLQVECLERELGELPRVLRRGEADFVLLDHEIRRAGWKAHSVGEEEYVLVEPTSRARRVRDVYLDHDPDDSTTERFFQQQAQTPQHFERSFLDEIYAILDGVRLGWGKAVVPRHLLKGDDTLRVARGYRPLKIPVVLHYFEQPYYPRLHQAIVRALVEKMPEALGG